MEDMKPIAPQPQEDTKKERRTRIGYIVSTALFALCIGVTVGAAGSALMNAQAEQVEEGPIAEAPAHEHHWGPGYETIHHEAVTDEVVHPATSETVVAYHTVCPDCETVIDGMAREHQEDTGHGVPQTNVPREETRPLAAEWTETVVLEEAWEEQKMTKVVCSGCGEWKPVNPQDAA